MCMDTWTVFLVFSISADEKLDTWSKRRSQSELLGHLVFCWSTILKAIFKPNELKIKKG